MGVQPVKCRLAWVAVGVLGSMSHPSAYSQEQDPVPQENPLPSSRRFFDRQIDYWQEGHCGKEAAPSPAMDANPPASKLALKKGPGDWGQRVMQADGTVATLELPRPLIDVLEDPSPENVRAYFEWKLTRTRKILRAAEALKAFRNVGRQDPEAPVSPVPDPEASREHAPQVPLPPPAPTLDPKAPFTLLYFHRRGCVHCEQQDDILRIWLGKNPGGTMLTLEFGEKPELWRQYRVRGTPSLVVQSRSTGRSIFLEGLAQAAELDGALARSAAAETSPPHLAKEGFPK
jgi:hypothetical protein